MNILLTVTLAVLGSSVVSTLITIFAERWRHDKHADVLKAWKTEVNLQDELETAANNKGLNEQTRRRYEAQAIVGAQHFVEAAASRLVPKDGAAGVIRWFGLVILVAFLIPASAIVLFGNDEALSAVFGDALLFSRVYIPALTILLAVAVIGGMLDSYYRGIMRRTVSEVLRGKQLTTLSQPDKTKLARLLEKPKIVGASQIQMSRDAVQFTWPAKMVLKPDVCDTFVNFLK